MAEAPVKHIAILGGGLGSLTTAFALTSRRNWREHYEITVYQMGWRLGGKGASGRNLDSEYRHRIEEHGFHVWMGFYDNAFSMLKQCYAELAPTTGPFRSWKDAFKKHSLVVIEEKHDGRRKHWPVEFPDGPREPGTVVQLGLFGYAARMFRLLYRRLPSSPSRATFARPVLRGAQRVWRALFVLLLMALAVAEYLLRLLENRTAGRLNATRSPAARALISPVRTALAWLARLARAGVEALTRLIVAWAAAADVTDEDDARHLRIFFDLSLAVLRGILVDDIIDRGFASIDHLEYKEWLRKHGARAESVDSAIVNAIYDGNFSFTNGDRSKPNFAAGVALHCFLRIFLDYKGGFLYKMQAGMGDVVVAPLYSVLERRGVRFRFFHRIDELVYDPETGDIAAIDVTEQVTLREEPYQPLVTVPVDGGVIRGWPSTPRYDSIVDGEELAASGINLESQWAAPWKGSRKKRLTRGSDFDLVVLGISIGAHPSVCRQLIDRLPAWRRMIEKVDTVATQAMQLWLSPDLKGLGWKTPTPLVVHYEDPAANWLDASQVIPHEPLTGERVGSVAYFCSALEDPPVIPPAGPSSFPENRLGDVRRAHRQWIEEHAGFLWPSVDAPGTSGVRWDLLHDPRNRQGAARLDWQYFRANVEPSDRFVLSSVGATRYRLPPGGSGVGNLFLAGDWTLNGFNGGCVEGTVMSGLLCSRAIAGYPRRIFGEHPFGLFNL